MDQSEQAKWSGKTATPQTPLMLARGLIKSGVTAQELASLEGDERALKRIAGIIRELSAANREMRALVDKIEETQRASVLDWMSPIHTLKVTGATRIPEAGYAKLIRGMSKLVVRPPAEELLEHETIVGTDEATTYKIALIPSAPFAGGKELTNTSTHGKIVQLFRDEYPRHEPGDVDPSVMVGLARKIPQLRSIARVYKLTWVLCMHRPISLMQGGQHLLMLNMAGEGLVELRTKAVTDQILWKSDGAFAFVVG